MPFLCLLIKSVLISGYRYPLGPDLYLHKSEFYVTVCECLCACVCARARTHVYRLKCKGCVKWSCSTCILYFSLNVCSYSCVCICVCVCVFRDGFEYGESDRIFRAAP